MVNLAGFLVSKKHSKKLTAGSLTNVFKQTPKGVFFRPKFLKTKILKPKSQSQKHSRKTGTGGDATLVLFENHVVLRILSATLYRCV